MESSFESVFWKVGPLAAGGMSLFATVTIYAKSKHPRSPIGRYMSSDICVFYQLWVHNICNVIFIAISVPQVHHFFSCNLCKWLVLYFGVINMLSQFPSVLDCTIRTNDTPFYEQFHSVSPYTHLLMIVMCTWVPFLSTLSVKSYYPQNALDPTRCDVIVVSPPFWMFMLRGIVMLAIACCYLYTIVIIIYRNERIPRAIIRHLNHIMLARILILLALIILLSVRNKVIDPDLSWAKMEMSYGITCCFLSLGDVTAALVLPPMKPAVMKIFARFTRVTQTT